MDFRIDFKDPAIGQQAHEMRLTNGAFFSELSDCRTFGHLQEVEALRSMGLARGGTLQNAIVVDQAYSLAAINGVMFLLAGRTLLLQLNGAPRTARWCAPWVSAAGPGSTASAASCSCDSMRFSPS